MIAQYECVHHQNKQLASVCLESHCRNRLSCEQCLSSNQEHALHEKVNFTKFMKVWDVVEKSKGKTRQLFRKVFIEQMQIFNEVSSKLQLYLKSLEAKVLSQFSCNIGDSEYLQISSLESQQIYGLVDQCLKNKSMKDMLYGKISQNKFLNSISESQHRISDLLGELESRILFEMNLMLDQMKKIKLEKEKEKQMILKAPLNIYSQIKKLTFSFSKVNKSKYLEISIDQSRIFRPFSEDNVKKNYLTVYGITSEPLTAANNEITFSIDEQKSRFMYFGICFPEPFQDLGFEGPVYQMGNGMFGIRQSEIPGKSAVSLHHSLQILSDKDIVGWDFKQGDRVKLVLQLEKKNLLFLLNDTFEFNMPLNSDKKQFFPFVGIKGYGGSISIIPQVKQREKKKGFFGDFFEF